jgi:hypothetical protein
MVKLIATEITDPVGEDLVLDSSSSISTNTTARDFLKVVVLYPSDFPGLELPGMLIVLALSVLVYCVVFLRKPHSAKV